MSRHIRDGAIPGALVGLFVGAAPACRYADVLDRRPEWPVPLGVSVLILWLPFVLCGVAGGVVLVSFIGDRLSLVKRSGPASRITMSGIALFAFSPVTSAVALACLASIAAGPGGFGYRPLLPYATLAATVIATLGSAAGGFLLRGGLRFRAVASLAGGLTGYVALPIAVALIRGPE